MDPHLEEQLRRFKQRYPGLDLDRGRGIIVGLHRVPILEIRGGRACVPARPPRTSSHGSE